MVEADYFGVESGNRVADKFARSGLTATKAETVNAPVINEFPLCLEREFIEYQENKYGCGVIGKIVNVTADERIMVDGKPDMSLVDAIAFDPLHPRLLPRIRACGWGFQRRTRAQGITQIVRERGMNRGTSPVHASPVHASSISPIPPPRRAHHRWPGACDRARPSSPSPCRRGSRRSRARP